MARLQEAMSAADGAEVLEEIRALVERVEVHAPTAAGGAPRIELIGELTALLRAGGVAVPAMSGGLASGHGKGPGAVAHGPGLVLGSVKVVAGTRNRLQLLMVG